MCLMLLGKGESSFAHEPFVVRNLRQGYERILPRVLQARRATVLLSLALIGAAVATIPFLGGEFMPDFRESNFVVFMAGKPDSSLAESVRSGRRMAEKLAEIPGIVSVAQQIGRADLSEDTWGPNISEVWVVTDEDADYDRLLYDVREKLADIPGYQFQVKQFLRERMDEVLTGSTADIVIRVVGPELGVLRNEANRIVSQLEGIGGVEDLRLEQQVEVPQIEVLLRPKDAARYAFSVGGLNQDIQTLLKGSPVGQVYEEDRVFDVIVRAAPEVRSQPAALGRLLVDAPTGDKIPLSAVAQISFVNAPNAINREAASRRILVTCNAEGRDVAGVMQEIQARLERVRKELPPGYHLEFAGQYEARAEAARRLILLSGAALIGIFVLLYLDFKSAGLSLLVMLSVPLACVGGVAAVLLSGGDVTLGSMVGFVTVFGIAVRNGILLISHYRYLRAEEHLSVGRELIVRGAADRLSPILMTASSTALALLPLVLRGNLPGHEIEYPMAIVIIGGLVSSTFLTLFLLPVLYEWFGWRFASA